MSQPLTNLFIATWDAVGYYPSRTDRVRHWLITKLDTFVFHNDILGFRWLEKYELDAPINQNVPVY